MGETFSDEMDYVATTTCNRDCPDACSIVAHVKKGRIVQLRGDKNHPITQGFLCHRTSHFLERQYADDRVLYPLIRRQGKLKRATWDEALDLIAERIACFKSESGAASIFHYQSGGSLGALMPLCGYFFDKLGPCTVKRGDICTGALDFAQKEDFGALEANDLADLENAANIIIWGKNVYTSSPHSIPFIKRAKKKGARVCLIDPIKHKTASLCDRFLGITPGGDFAFAMALARRFIDDPRMSVERENVVRSYSENYDDFRALVMRKSEAQWLEASGLNEEDCRDIAERLWQGPTTLMIGWGMGRRKEGAAIVRAVDALALLSGNIGKPGTGAMYYFNRKSAFDCSFRPKCTPPRTISEPLFGQALQDAQPSVRMLWVTAGNPVAMLPDAKRVKASIEKTEFVVVVDSWMSDTAKLADVVLPCATLLEDDDLVAAYGHHYIGVSKPVVPPLGEAKSDFEILRALAPRVGLGDLFGEGALAWKKRIANKKLKAHGLSLTALEEKAQRNPCAKAIAFEDQQFCRPSKKARFLSLHDDYVLAACEKDQSRDDDYPFYLFSVSTPKGQASQMARPREGFAIARVHPSSGLRDGATMRLSSRIGSIVVTIELNDSVEKDVVWMDKGGQLSDGGCANALLEGALTDAGEGAALYDERVRFSEFNIEEKA